MNLLWSDVLLPEDAGEKCIVLMLGQTKRGRDQKVVIDDDGMVTWFLKYTKRFRGRRRHSRVFDTSYHYVRRALLLVCQHLKLGDALFTTHSFRRGWGHTPARARQSHHGHCQLRTLGLRV